MTQEKNMSWFVAQIKAAIPKAVVEAHRPRGNAAAWILDARYETEARGERYVVVMWSKSEGFGLATPDEDWNYGDVPTEHHHDPGEALERVVHLLKSGEKARTRREMQLQQLRKHRKVSQEMLAKTMNVTQASVSQTEGRDDVLLSTLQSYIAGLGGELHVIARFPGETIELEFGDEHASRR